MRKAVFDTSAIIPSLLQHDCSLAAEQVLKQFDPIVLAFTRIEFANTLRNLFRAGQLDRQNCREALHVLDAAYPITSNEDLIAPALDLAIEYQHSVYDCIYVTAARMGSLSLVTADKRLAAKFEDYLDGRILNLYDLPASLA